MTTEIGASKPRPIDFTKDEKKLAVRSLPLSLGVKMQGITEDRKISGELIAEIVSTCVVYEDGSQVWTVDEVLQNDMAPMLQLFHKVSGAMATIEDAGKN